MLKGWSRWAGLCCEGLFWKSGVGERVVLEGWGRWAGLFWKWEVWEGLYKGVG